MDLRWQKGFKMAKIKIYLAGALLDFENECSKWRNEVKEKLGDDNYIFLDPVLIEVNFENPADIINTDKNMIIESDIVLVDWAKISAGTSMEIIFAWNNNKTIYIIDSGAPMSLWVTYHSDAVVKSIDEAVEIIRNNYER